MTRGAMCPTGVPGAREPAWRYARTSGATKAPSTASAVTSAGYNMGLIRLGAWLRPVVIRILGTWIVGVWARYDAQLQAAGQSRW
jgi:hypothetical protein